MVIQVAIPFTQDHPRGCGEHVHSVKSNTGWRGSSPRMRGAPYCHVEWVAHGGIIPADAGSTVSGPAGWRCSADHPRGCGEHSLGQSTTPTAERSSPRMRGARGADAALAPVGGIIPADVGSTPFLAVMACAFWDHPRGCGEHMALNCAFFSRWGSSPRMRGAPAFLAWSRCHRRIIPADAGSTPAGRWCVSASRDHPRGCGEHTVPVVMTARACGSSPRMRGAQALRYAAAYRSGIIPADAGSTTAWVIPFF